VDVAHLRNKRLNRSAPSKRIGYAFHEYATKINNSKSRNRSSKNERIVGASSIMIPFAFVLILYWIVGAWVVDGRQFNLEVENRIRERLDFFLAGPVDTGRVLSGFRRNGGFPC
jgi:hypothetical protein